MGRWTKGGSCFLVFFLLGGGGDGMDGFVRGFIWVLFGRFGGFGVLMGEGGMDGLVCGKEGRKGGGFFLVG